MLPINQPKKESFFVSSRKLKKALLATAIFLSGCNSEVQVDSKRIVAVEPIVCDLVNAIAPPSIPVNCLIQEHQDPHNFKITPQAAQTLNESTLIITLGREMTPSIAKWIKKPSTILVGVSAIKRGGVSEHHEGNHDDHLHYGLDPHIWHDPLNIRQMSNLIADSINRYFLSSDNRKSQILEERRKIVNSVLLGLDQWNRKQIATIPIKNRFLASKHKAMEYYAYKYGFNTLGLLNYLGHSGSLRPETISSVMRKLKENNVQALFAEQNPPSKLIKSISRKSSIPIASKPIYVDGIKPGGSIITTAISNTCIIVNSLSGACNNQTGQSLKVRWESLVR
ncbi:metal ABC transporter substrate-binding protein [Prochlorococcus sp. MIT 1341]|uniref:metal ABC transporter substrate-binding protein n=1 Tax=Prochlorococcus sp. MIT 1341 TaxID=3096221 RepID=UPI002A75DC4D|nr:metal ABC transporter substrate-binding protein [Prochlorococcus sp. MIT 1341]